MTGAAQGLEATTFEWTPDLALGVQAIDDQHRELFRRAGRLLESARGGDPSELLHLLGYLGEYVVTHFEAEEALMAEVRYPEPDAAAHRAQHAKLTAKFRHMRDGFARAGADDHLASEVRRELCDWLRQHVDATDRALAVFLRR